LYYPLILGAVNFAKEHLASPAFVWVGNGLLAILAGFFALPPVRKH